ncbi:MAG TPA: hypothetical protein VG819_05305 [Rhizomicrobium sp.]|nr:hypothetical protein [Rhizomicrobium sp.]
MSILAAVGLKREARIVESGEVRAVVGGGDSSFLDRQLRAAAAPETRGIVSIGVAGALSAALEVGDVVIGARVIAGERIYDADIRWTSAIAQKLTPSTPVATVAGSDVLAATAEEKAALRSRAHGAWAVDMESQVAASVATELGIPFAVVRVTSDPSWQSLPPAARVAMRRDGGISYCRVLLSVLGNPGQIPALIRTGQDSEKAFAALLHCCQALGPGLGCPYLA